jgi:hypothetical protein
MSFQLQVGHYLYIKPCGVLGSAIHLIYQSFIFDIHTPLPIIPLTPHPSRRVFRIITSLLKARDYSE